MTTYKNLKLSKEVVNKMDDMVIFFRDELERYGYKPSRGGLIHYLYRKERENMVEALRKRGLDITTKEKLSELDKR